MLRAIAEIAFQKQIDCQISMEQKMACGIGTCLGCVIKTKDGYKKVCGDGPVFNAKEIIWQG
jgi:dihydroorotate dehydrogenase electron transfer subunit